MAKHLTDFANRPAAARLPLPASASLRHLTARAAHQFPDWDCDLIHGCDGEAMLIIADRDGLLDAPTFVVTAASATHLRLEVIVDERRFDLLAEAPPHRVLARLADARIEAAPLAAAKPGA